MIDPVQRKNLMWLVVINMLVTVAHHFAQGGLPWAPPPFACEGLHVLIVEQSSVRKDLPAGQKEIITSATFADWLNSNCPADATGTKGWRILEPTDGDKLTYEDQWLKDAMAVDRASVPWVVASNGHTGFSGPLPLTAAELLDKLKPLGGK